MGNVFHSQRFPEGNLEWENEHALNKQYHKVSGAAAAHYWACYAWPASYGNTGKRTFFINQSGQILVCTNDQTRYSGAGNDPDGEAVLIPSSNDKMNGPLAINMTGNDGNFWKIVQ